MCATKPSARASRPPVCPTAGSAAPLAVRLTDSRALSLSLSGFRLPRRRRASLRDSDGEEVPSPTKV